MKLTPKQEAQLRLLSDEELYRQAMAFVQESGTIENKQMSGLLEFSRSWKELEQFVNHQEGRDWGQPGKSKKAYYKTFYTKLKEQLKQLRSFIPSGLTEEEADYFAGRLAREFIQHLVAEMRWKEAKLS